MATSSLKLATVLLAAAAALQIFDNESIPAWGGGQQGRTNIKTLHILFTRHALSCANVAKDFPAGGKWGWYESIFSNPKSKLVAKIAKQLEAPLYKVTHPRALAHLLVEDPLLSECGAYRSRSLRQVLAAKLKKMDGVPPVSYVLASHLLRSIETASYMYGDEGVTIVPVPYISETGFGLDNEKKELDDQVRITQDMTRFAKVDWKWIEEGKYSYTKPKFDDFMNFLAEKVLPDADLFKGRKKTATIAVVSHSHFMKKMPIYEKYCGKGKPQNNEVFAFKYTVRVSNGTYSMEIDESGYGDGPGGNRRTVCKNVMSNIDEAQEKLKEPKELCPRDVGCELDLVETIIETSTKADCCTPKEDWRNQFVGSIGDYKKRMEAVKSNKERTKMLIALQEERVEKREAKRGLFREE